MFRNSAWLQTPKVGGQLIGCVEVKGLCYREIAEGRDTGDGEGGG